MTDAPPTIESSTSVAAEQHEVEAPFSVEEFSRRTGASVDWIRRHLNLVPHHRPTPRRVLFTQKDVEDYLEQVRKVPRNYLVPTDRSAARRGKAKK